MSRGSIARIICREYCAENFVFAARFLAKERLTKCERFWWIIWIVASFAACCVSMITMYRKWDESPVVITYASRFSPISSVPFPAITICPLTKARVEEFNLTDAFERIKHNSTLDDESEKNMRTMAHVCPFSPSWKVFKEYQMENVFHTLKKISINFNDTMGLCMWRYKHIPCSSIITETLVDDGICYTFNALVASELYRNSEISPDFLNFTSPAVPSDWTQDTGYNRMAGLHAYPHRSLAGGINSGLTMVLKLRKIDQEFLCRGPYTGYKIAVHAPDAFPVISERFFRLNTLNAVILTLRPQVNRISSQLRKLPPARRFCFFNDERYLRFFKIYNQVNCLVECVVNYTLAHCGCVRFSFPRSASMKVCDASKIACYQRALFETFTRIINADLKNSPRHCHCLPACNSLQYNVDISQFPFLFHQLAQAMTVSTEEYKSLDSAAMFVLFKSRHYLPLWRREMMGATDALAKFGGLFALLMGASLLSLGEILYYGCIRPLRRERVRKVHMHRVRPVIPWEPQNHRFKV